jgi:hypothetical protein
MPIVAYHLQCIIQWIGDSVEVVQGETSLTVAATEAQGWSYDHVSCISRKAWDTKYLSVHVRCQGSNGPGGPLGLGLGIRSSPCLGVK